MLKDFQPMTLKKQKRGGRGINATKFKDGDEAKLLCEAHT